MPFLPTNEIISQGLHNSVTSHHCKQYLVCLTTYIHTTVTYQQPTGHILLHKFNPVHTSPFQFKFYLSSEKKVLLQLQVQLQPVYFATIMFNLQSSFFDTKPRVHFADTQRECRDK